MTTHTDIKDKLKINYKENPSHEETSMLWMGIATQSTVNKGHEPVKPFAFFVQTHTGEIKGGCSGYILYGSMYLELLWVDDSLRGQKLGTQLILKAEKLAIENKCRFIVVNTMEFESPEFYKKLGFTIEFERHGFAKNSVMYFLRKDLVTEK